MIRSKPWWNGEIDEKRKIMRTRWREWKVARTIPARNQFNAVRNTFYNAIREAKSKNWNDFLQGAKGKEIFTAMRYTKPRRTDPTRDIIHGEERAQTFMEKAKLFHTASVRTGAGGAPDLPGPRQNSPPRPAPRGGARHERTPALPCSPDEAP